jgi:outer membrane protein assembly factor BamD (BamD/ComL family)
MKLEEYRENMAAGHFDTVIEQSNQILAENDTKPPADVALFSLGKVYAHYDFAGRDYELSQDYFEKLIENFPDSELAPEARTYISLFEAIAAREKETAAAELTLLQKGKIVSKEKKSASLSGKGRVVVDRNFEEAVEKNEQIVEEFGTNKPADEALYNLGLIYAHVDNPAKDYNKSRVYFHMLSKQFPDSVFAEEARIWLGLFETIEKMQQIDIDIEQQKKQLTR